MTYHIECRLHGRLMDIESGRFTTKRDANVAALEAQTSSDAWTVDLQARFDEQLANNYRAMVVDDMDGNDKIAGLRRIAPRYTYMVAPCAGKRCNH